jgi:chaperonin GroEL (HSP60 family)
MYLFLGSYTECVAFLRVIPAKVATIAANGDEQIGKMITEAFEKAGWMMNW